MIENNINVLSLFDGMSCGQIALERAGIKVGNYYASEIDKHAIKVTQHNYPDTIQLGDVTQVNGSDLPKIDLLIGGSPCQGFSFAGKQLNFDDPRSKLFFEFVRLLEETKPKYFLLENVRMKKEYQDVITEYLGVEPVFICSSNFSAQKRKRLYWTNIPGLETKKETKKGKVLADILESNIGANTSRKYLTEEQVERAHRKHAKQQLHTGTKMGAVKFPTPLNEKSKCCLAVNVIADRSVTHIQDEVGIRMPTPLEFERLQTVPDSYTACVSNTQRYRMLGNGWTVDVITHIFKHLKIEQNCGELW